MKYVNIRAAADLLHRRKNLIETIDTQLSHLGAEP